MPDPATLRWRPYPDLPDAERLARAGAFLDSMATRRSGANHQPWHFAAIAAPDAFIPAYACRKKSLEQIASRL